MRAVLLIAILSLFFFQQLADFIAAVYALGLLGTNVPPEIVSVAFILSPFLLVFFRKRPSAGTVAILAVLGIACRFAEPFFGTRMRMIVAGLGTGIFLFAAPLSRASIASAAPLSLGLALGLVLSNLLRAFGSGLDISTLPSGWPVGTVLSLAALLLLFANSRAAAEPGAPAAHPTRARGFGKTVAFAVGIAAAAAVLFFGFVAVNVVARWSDLPYWLVAGLAFLGLALFACALVVPAVRGVLYSKAVLIAANAVFLASLAASLLLYGVRFPADPSAYPFTPAAAPAWACAPLFLALLLFPVFIADISVMAGGLGELQPSARRLGAAFGIASLALLLLIFAHVFTTVYDYIPIAGPLFRNRFWLVNSIATLIAFLPLFLLDEGRGREASRSPLSTRVIASALVLIGLAAVIWIAASEPRPSGDPSAASLSASEPRPSGDPSAASLSASKPRPSAEQGASLSASDAAASSPAALRVLTYNIQQGYSSDGALNYGGQLAVMQAADADVIGLQETDSNRVANGNDDIVRYLARRLDMRSVYGPPVTAGTFGIALLSRLPIENPRVFYMYSTGEQTAAIVARVVKAGKRYTVLVTHLGNDGPMIQLRQVLAGAAGLENLIAMGDFNFRPVTAQHSAATALLTDAWEVARFRSADPEIDIGDRIDYMFLSSALSAISVRYFGAGASDHPALQVVVGP